MEPYTLIRSGMRPVSFTGTLLAAASSSRPEGIGAGRWHDLALYRTDAGSCVLEIVARSNEQDEGEHHLVRVGRSLADLDSTLLTYNPARILPDSPSADLSEGQLRSLRADLRRRWERAVTELMAPFPASLEEATAPLVYPEGSCHIAVGGTGAELPYTLREDLEALHGRTEGLESPAGLSAHR